MEVETPVLTSTTAPGKVFGSRGELAEHYKSQWHKYNLKRREAGLPPLLETDFEARLAAAQEALEQQQKGKQTDGHLKKGKKDRRNKKQQQKLENGAATVSSQVPAYDRMKQEGEPSAPAAAAQEESKVQEEKEEAKSEEEKMMEAAQQIEIDPRQCLFDKHVSASVQDNIDRMQRKYGFFVPDQEYLADQEGLVGYCHEKIKIGRICLYCQKGFGTWEGCQKHMVQKRHAKLRYEAGVDLEEYTVFYDFQEANQEFLVSRRVGGTATEQLPEAMDENDDDIENDDDEWEDISDDEEEEKEGDDMDIEETNEDDDEVFADYERDVAAMGLDVTPLGELIFPDGRIIGHRAFRRYYNQRAPRTADNRTSVAAARHAAGDRIYQGRIVNVNDAAAAADSNAIMAQQAGLKPSLLVGGVGKGVLVAHGNSGAFTQLSIYRYRAVLRKQRRDDAKGGRLHARSHMNTNKMDKKHNRLMNGVSVAHAKR